MGNGKRVILGYAYKNNHKGLFDTDLFWPAVKHLWANTDQMKKLETYMNDNICHNNHNPSSEYSNSDDPIIHLSSVMAELTPSIEGVIFQRYHGLRELAAMTNTNYEHWFRERWWRCVNIVAGDFFLGSDLVQIAIDVNQRRFSENNGNHTKKNYETSVLVN